ncbi:MAG: hypothetical protein OXC44_06160 [Proteobacteria bacterium]|nr:hypothetical protein [Pseudomonadota bacterium]
MFCVDMATAKSKHSLIICALFCELVSGCGDIPITRRQGPTVTESDFVDAAAEPMRGETVVMSPRSRPPVAMEGEEVVRMPRIPRDASRIPPSTEPTGISSNMTAENVNANIPAGSTNPMSTRAMRASRAPVSEACDDPANQVIQIGSYAFAMAETYVQLSVFKHMLHKRFEFYYIDVTGRRNRFIPGFRNLISGHWYRHASVGEREGYLVLKFVRTSTDGAERHEYIHPLGELIKKEAVSEEGENYLLNLSAYGACLATYKNAAGAYFSGGMPLLLLPKLPQVEHYLRATPLK